MALADLGDFLEDDGLEVPVPGGKTYSIPSPDAATGLRLTAMVNVGVAAAAGGQIDEHDRARLSLDDEQEREFLEQILGSAYQEMIDDGVSWVRIQRVGRYALLFFTLGKEAADTSLRGAASGEAQAPNRATRRAKTSATGSSGTAASPTRRRASTASTTSRRKPAAG